MKNKGNQAGILFLVLSLFLAGGALGFFCYNFNLDKKAARQSKEILDGWETMELQPDGDSGEMAKTASDGSYLYILDIPKLGLSLPVNAQWTEEASNVSPCRYQGSLTGQNLIIAGHNYPSHFGTLEKLQAGDHVYITDTQQRKQEYAVEWLEILDGAAVDGMQAGDWDLTLFTCNYVGDKRVTVRCRIVTPEQEIGMEGL